jgi:hypothetical protein
MRWLYGGAVAGLAGTAAMTLFIRAVRGTADPQEKPARRPAEPATRAVARELTADPPRALQHAVHWCYGIQMGVAYALLRRRVRAPGMLFGLGVWLVADEALLPLLGLSETPEAYPARVHAEMLAAHAIYGGVTEMVQRQFE